MHFEQTHEWARFQQAVGRKVYTVSRSGITPRGSGKEDMERENGIAVERKLFGPFRYLEINGWMAPSGDVDQSVAVLKAAGLAQGSVFARWTPPIQSSVISSQLSDLVVLPRILVHQVPPKATRMIELMKSEHELLEKMHEKTRYNIRLAERKGVIVRQIEPDDHEGFEMFWRLMRETAQRDMIGIHTKEYYRTMEEVVRNGDAHAYLFLAVNNDTPLATAILIVCDDIATYLHGGSSNEQRNLMASYLLQWRMIQFAKIHGCRWYDMWGVAPEALRTHNSKIKTQIHDSWAGITRFKTGFGGEVRESAGTFDVVCKPMVYEILSSVRAMIISFKNGLRMVG